jgi:hypothetical protein
VSRSDAEIIDKLCRKTASEIMRIVAGKPASKAKGKAKVKAKTKPAAKAPAKPAKAPAKPAKAVPAGFKPDGASASLRAAQRVFAGQRHADAARAEGISISAVSHAVIREKLRLQVEQQELDAARARRAEKAKGKSDGSKTVGRPANQQALRAAEFALRFNWPVAEAAREFKVLPSAVNYHVEKLKASMRLPGGRRMPREHPGDDEPMTAPSERVEPLVPVEQVHVPGTLPGDDTPLFDPLPEEAS